MARFIGSVVKIAATIEMQVEGAYTTVTTPSLCVTALQPGVLGTDYFILQEFQNSGVALNTNSNPCPHLDVIEVPSW